MDASAWGIGLDPDLDNNAATNNIKIGKVKINLDATIDLVGEGANNKTAAQLLITNDIGSGAQKVLTAVYKNEGNKGGTLTLETDLSIANNQVIAKEALYPLAKLIKEAAVGTAEEPVAAPYKLFGDLANEVIAEMFTLDAQDNVTSVNANFTTIRVTQVDIATLAKGAFYAIFSDFATKAGDEKPADVELSTYKGDTYKLNSKTYKDGQYAWSLDIKQTATTVLKAIKYAGTASQKDKDYSIELTSIYATLKSIFKKGTIEDVDKSTKADVAAPSTVEEMMALFMCTNDGILLDLTKHGILPLYDETTGITDKYITSTYTPEKAAKDGYYAISGKMISKDNAIKLWRFLTSDGSTNLTLTGITTGSYVKAAGDDTNKNTQAGYVQNSTINWFMKFIKGTTLVDGKSSANVIDYVTGTDSAIKISLNRATGAMSCDIKLANKSTTGYITYTISGSDTAYVPTAELTAISNTTDVTTYADCKLNTKFYNLFKAAFGMGPTTVIDAAHDNYGINKDIYYFAESATYANGKYSAIEYSGFALIRVATDTEGVYDYYVVTNTTAGDGNHGFIDVDVDDSTAGVIVISGTNAGEYAGTYDVYGTAYRVLVEQPVPQP